MTTDWWLVMELKMCWINKVFHQDVDDLWPWTVGVELPSITVQFRLLLLLFHLLQPPPPFLFLTWPRRGIFCASFDAFQSEWANCWMTDAHWWVVDVCVSLSLSLSHSLKNRWGSFAGALYLFHHHYLSSTKTVYQQTLPRGAYQHLAWPYGAGLSNWLIASYSLFYHLPRVYQATRSLLSLPNFLLESN